jgi:ABC-type transporter lipoprotein component MlaA
MRQQNMMLCQKRRGFLGPAATLVLMVFICFGYAPLDALSASPDPTTGTGANVPAAVRRMEETGSLPLASPEKISDEYGDVAEEDTKHIPSAPGEKSSDEYGNVTEEEGGKGEGLRIADPIEPFNRAIYHVNDKIYFWVFKPAARGYKYVVPEAFRGLFSNFYHNLKAPIRIVNNFLQGKPGYAGLELATFFINSTVGIGGLRNCAKECFGIDGRYADFGQTLGKYGIGFGFYVVWPILGPSSPRDTVGWMGVTSVPSGSARKVWDFTPMKR